MSTGCRRRFGSVNRVGPTAVGEQDVVMQRERVEPRATGPLSGGPPPIARFRPDIQGLRAVAVIAVISHHLLVGRPAVSSASMCSSSFPGS